MTITMTMMKMMVLHFALTPLTLAAVAAAEFGSVIYQVGHQRLPCTIPQPTLALLLSSIFKLYQIPS